MSSFKKEYKAHSFISVADQKSRSLQLARERKIKKKLKIQAEIQRRRQEALNADVERNRQVSHQRWEDCLNYLQKNVTVLSDNPYLIINEPAFIHAYLDSLTEILSNLSRHDQDLETVRQVLHSVYSTFVDLGKWSRYQPCFYIDNSYTLKRINRLLEQVAHRGSDKALYPNVLCLLTSTFERPELYDILNEIGISRSLMAFARTEWLPQPSTLQLLLAIFEQLSQSEAIRDSIIQDEGYNRLMKLTYGAIEGFTKEQQDMAKQALQAFPVPNIEITESEDPNAVKAKSIEELMETISQDQLKRQQEQQEQ